VQLTEQIVPRVNHKFVHRLSQTLAPCSNIVCVESCNNAFQKARLSLSKLSGTLLSQLDSEIVSAWMMQRRSKACNMTCHMFRTICPGPRYMYDHLAIFPSWPALLGAPARSFRLVYDTFTIAAATCASVKHAQRHCRQSKDTIAELCCCLLISDVAANGLVSR
jgi:hypothetical protein